jgi:hypothetical protein
MLMQFCILGTIVVQNLLIQLHSLNHGQIGGCRDISYDEITLFPFCYDAVSL